MRTNRNKEINMKVVLVNGSPHPKGCTFTALSEIAAILNEKGVETEFFWIGNKPVGGCIDCRKCVDRGLCVFNDAVNDFLGMAGSFDGFVFGSPVHWGATSGNMKSFMDRAFFADFCGNGRRFLFKPAACAASARRSGIVTTTDQMNRYFSLSQMPIVTSRYWDGVHGMNPDEVRKDLEGVQTMRFLARNMAWLLQCLEAAKKQGIKLPEQERVSFTNFIH